MKYESSLFKEFAVCDLKHYKTGNVRSRSYSGNLFYMMTDGPWYQNPGQTLHLNRWHSDGAPKLKSSRALVRKRVEIHAAHTMNHKQNVPSLP